MSANKNLNLIDMSTVNSVKSVMTDTLRRRGIDGLSENIQAALGNFDFAYAIPNAVANHAEACIRHAQARFDDTQTNRPGDAYELPAANRPTPSGWTMQTSWQIRTATVSSEKM